MKCPFCKTDNLSASKNPDYSFCDKCGHLVYSKTDDDPDRTKYKYDVDAFRSKAGDPIQVFDAAREKFNKGKYEVVALRIVRGDYSFFGGQMYTVVKKKIK